MVAYGWKTVSLPIGLELLNFEVKRNEGSDSPAGFKSSLRVVSADGETATGSCWMNNPFSYPGTWWRTWTGLTYKISQASWNPENLGQSTVQILRDPGWLLKWIGSLLVVIGVFMMFYLQPYRKQTEGEPITPSAPDAGGKRYKSGSRCGNHALDSATTAQLSNARKAAQQHRTPKRDRHFEVRSTPPFWSALELRRFGFCFLDWRDEPPFARPGEHKTPGEGLNLGY